ncbi:MAG: YdbH domain-containing protein [Desulfobacter sp.]|nr:MAG: YdbH domain-containing protein [Desulfobacter sp.]
MSFKSLVKYLVFICLVAVIGCQALIIGLPLIAESQIKSRFPAAVRALEPDFRIEGIGPGCTILRAVRLGRGLSADLVELKYRWLGGRDVQVEKLLISGLSLEFTVDDSGGATQLRFNHMVFPDTGSGGDAPRKTVSMDQLEPFFPLVPGEIRIKHAQITIRRGDGSILIPADIMVRLDMEDKRADIRMAFTPLGQPLELTASVNLETLLSRTPEAALDRVDARVDGFNPKSLAGFFPEIFRNVDISGPVDFHLVRQGQGPWEIDMHGGAVKKGLLPEIALEGFRGQVKTDGGISFKGKGEAEVRDNAFSRLALGVDLTVAQGAGGMPGFDLSFYNRDKEAFTLYPAMAQWICSQNLPEKIRIDGPMLSGTIAGNLERQTASLAFKGRRLGVSLPGTAAGAQDLSLSLQMDRRHGGPFPIGSGSLELAAKEMVMETEDARLAAPGLRFKAGVRPDKKGEQLVLALDGEISGITGRGGGGTVSAGRAGIFGQIRMDKRFQPAASLTAGIDNLDLAVPGKNIAATGIQLRLPWTFPHGTGSGKGRLNIGTLRYDKRFTASLAAELEQTGKASIAMAGNISTPLVPDLSLGLDLVAGVDDTLDPWAEIRLKAENFLLTGQDVTRIMPQADIPGTLQVDLSPSVRIHFKKNTLDTGATILIHDGSLDFPDQDVKASGVSGRVEFNDLVKPESLPGQSLFVKSVNAGQFSFENMAMRFSVEDGRFLNVENLTFNWCNGLVSTESIRLPGEEDKLKLILYCDRLEMDSLLQQMGAFDARGGGALSGRIPVVYSRGEIAFDNGFLFSTPGQGGRVFVKDLDRMLEGFPRGTPEFSQLDLAGEALKDFEYKWAKLRLNTSGDTLDVKMELDGKPARILPFEYKREMNSFMRVDASSPGSRFQGVKLDVNLKLPFNRVMKFGTKLRSILE